MDGDSDGDEEMLMERGDSDDEGDDELNTDYNNYLKIKISRDNIRKKLEQSGMNMSLSSLMNKHKKKQVQKF